jgi:hypothetical protein
MEAAWIANCALPNSSGTIHIMFVTLLGEVDCICSFQCLLVTGFQVHKFRQEIWRMGRVETERKRERGREKKRERGREREKILFMAKVKHFEMTIQEQLLKQGFPEQTVIAHLAEELA